MTAPSQRPTRSRWRQALHDRLTRHQRASASSTLGWRNVYVLPSKAGLMLAITLLVLLVASINFQLNLGYLLTFLIAGSALASLWLGHRNLHGLQLQLATLHPVYQGERASVPVVLQVQHGAPARHGLSLALNRTHGTLAWVHTDVQLAQPQQLVLGSTPHQRGWHRVPRIVLETRYPLGVFRLWSYWQPQARILVYPAPETPTPPLHPSDHSHTNGQLAQPTGTTEQDGVRLYQRGDALRNIVWKKAAVSMASGSGELVVRSGQASASHTLWLDARATGLSDTEAQISRLTAWVLYAHQQHWPWGLLLPSGLQIAPASGESHLAACLMALAIDGKPHST